MALGLLADRWARARGGVVTALIVDHGLRPEAAAEARRVAGWLAARGIVNATLVWQGRKPVTGIQAAAREARYRLLCEWCRRAGVLHLLLGHQRDDQAETVALRRARASGPDGLAGMAAVRELSGLRLLRPLLDVPRARLRATLEAAGQAWIDDPGNRALAFARGRLRRRGGLDSAALTGQAAARARERAALDRRVAAWLVAHARVDPSGCIEVAVAALRTAPCVLARRALQQVLLCAGGALYPPRGARLERLLVDLRGGLVRGARTLAGCLVIERGERLLICREAGAITDEQPLEPGADRRWDGRFLVRLEGAARGLRLGPLRTGSWRALGAVAPARVPPAPVRAGLPALWRADELVAVPHLGLIAPGVAGRVRVEAQFRPRYALAGAPFAAAAAHWRPPPATTPLLQRLDRLC